MKVEVTAIEATCDNPPCGSIQTAVDPADIGGYSGSVLYTSSAGGWGAEWFACKPGCIRGAVMHSLKVAD
jgi:hypothetical protein